jgi:hypothetical protein
VLPVEVHEIVQLSELVQPPPQDTPNELMTGGGVQVAEGLLSMILNTCQTPWATIK